MEPTQKPITVVYRVALLSLVVMAAFVLLILFGHRGHKAEALADPLTVAAKYEPHAHVRLRASHRTTMALSTVGYTVSGAGTTAVNGNYVSVVGANATYNGATQYTNGTYFIAWSTAVWTIDASVNIGSSPSYTSSSGSATSFPLSGWNVLAGGGTSPAPTFVDMSGGGGGGAPVVRRPPIFF